MKDKYIVCLGRYGDIINALPIAMDEYRKTGVSPKFVVSKEFWSILDGCRYVRPVVWDIRYSDLQSAIDRLRRGGVLENTKIAQCYQNPDQRRLTESYQIESYRVAGVVDLFGNGKPIIDNRNAERESELVKSVINHGTGTKILFAGNSVSSPINGCNKLLAKIRESFPGFSVIDMSGVVADRVYDILGLYDAADMLITVDTMHLHLARAHGKIPTISIINNGWFGSVPPDNSIATIRYSEFNEELIIEKIESHFNA